MAAAFDTDMDASRRGARLRPVAAVGLIGALLAGAFGARASIVRLAPRSAILFELVGLPVNLAGLAVDRVTAKILADGERRVLVVEGDLVNSGDREEAARPLAVSVRGAADETLYTWITRAPQQRIAVGERAAFVARLASPPAGGANVVVEFDRPDGRESGGGAKKAPTRSRLQGSRTESQ